MRWIVGVGIFLVGAAGAGIGGCTINVEAPLQPSVPPAVQQTVGSQGGDVTNSEGSGVDIPPGALPGNVDVSVTPAPSTPPPTNSNAVGTPYVFGPSGVQFAKPVTVILAFDASKLPAGTRPSDIVVFTAPDGTTNYQRLPTTLRDATHVAAETTHFSIFVPVIPPPGASADDASTCTPLTCATGGWTCGAHDDGCGGTIDCGQCAVADAAVADAGAPGSDSGTVDDAGGLDASAPVDSGSASGGDAGVMADASTDAGPCKPLLCGNYGPGACGPLSDGCGGMLDCGQCPSGGDGGAADASATVDAGTAPDGGVCMPLTCANYPQGCGTYNDGCGGAIQCTGGCTGADGGSGGSDAGVCKPMSCQPSWCGTFGDGCGGVLQCAGGCVGADGGAADATASADGGACVPMTCAQMGYNCGMQGDGCGGVMDCGSCQAPLTCGGSGKNGVCG